MNSNLLSRALALIENVTPLKTDCGALCGAACCRDDNDAGGGVWLLPGEDAGSMTWGHCNAGIMPVTKEKCVTLFCDKPCERGLRPFMCRIFPLSPYFSKKREEWDVRIDRRSAMLCPLFAYGTKGLNPEFVANCRAAVRLLAEDDEYLELLEKLQAEEAAYRIEL